MNLYSNNRAVERAQPWLGTLVSIRVEGLPQTLAHQAIDQAFDDIATVHRLMSFYDPASDVSGLNRAAAQRPVEVHLWTYRVLEEALRFSGASRGCFDVSIAAELVEWRMLPAPPGAKEPRGSWRDIELLSGNRVVFHRPLWIDLGGIAKGFAVDCAAECLASLGVARAVINAGGDMRVVGSEPEWIRLASESSGGASPVLELADGSVASSSSATAQLRLRGQPCGPHVNGSSRRPAPADRFACVIATRCIVADALTKVVMARGRESADVLRQLSASAHLKDPHEDWQQIGAKEAVLA